MFTFLGRSSKIYVWGEERPAQNQGHITMNSAYIPVREEAIEYLETCCFWEVKEAVDPEGVLDPRDLDEAMVSWALEQMTRYYRELALRD